MATTTHNNSNDKNGEKEEHGIKRKSSLENEPHQTKKIKKDMAHIYGTDLMNC
jgi:hypothetical protein